MAMKQIKFSMENEDVKRLIDNASNNNISSSQLVRWVMQQWLKGRVIVKT